VVPGQGRLRGFKIWGFDYANASGYISYSPVKNINISLGHGKHFIGEGYRSVIMSDQSFNYPYLKIISEFGKLQYIFMLTSFQSAQNADSRDLVFQRKHGSFIYLNYIFNKYLQAGIFEGVMFKTMGDGYNNRFPVWYFIPVLFSRTAVYGTRNDNNVLLGLNVKLNLTKTITLYTQFALDDYEKQKYAYQTGIKFYNLFWLKNLYAQVEYNYVKPFTYSHEDEMQNWSYYNEAFASTPGSGFTEWVGILRYRLNDFIISTKINQIYTSYETHNENYGINIFKSDNTAGIDIKNAKPGQVNPYYKYYYNYRLSYLINPSTNFQIYVEYTKRNLSYEKSFESFYLFGIRTYLRNHYYDL
jgi:hypothetical protein